MRLDLLIPTYNRMHLLPGCLQSVLDARLPDGMKVTIVVIDNNSKDGTRDVIKSFSRDSTLHVEYVYAGRQGRAAALNAGIAATGSEFVGMIDDDEFLDKGWFEVVVREFSRDAELEYIGGPYHPKWMSEKPEWLPPSYPGVIGIVRREEERYFDREFCGMLMGGNVAIRRSTLAKVMPYPEKYGKIGNKARGGEDEVIYHRLLDLGAKGKVVPDLVIYHLIPQERLTKSYYRHWVWGRGMALGAQLRERSGTIPNLLGIPRYKFGAAARGLKAVLARKSQSERFTGELDVLDWLGTLWGRFFY
jgi:glycosyltransferase involved in cell wall biosynthesis